MIWIFPKTEISDDDDEICFTNEEVRGSHLLRLLHLPNSVSSVIKCWLLNPNQVLNSHEREDFVHIVQQVLLW